MGNRLKIHPQDPQQRLIAVAVDALRQGQVIAYPTDSSYALGCGIGEKAALDRIRQIRRTEIDHDFTLVCRDLSEISTYARVDNAAYRLLKSLTPGPYTFVLRATGEAPKRLQDPKRKSIGLRVPDNRIALALLDELGEAIMSTTLQLPEDDVPLTEPDDIVERLGNRVDIIIDGGACGLEPTTILDLSRGRVDVIRRGKGSIEGFDN
ncbi:MAG: threonylcarbamoyl-AMP synthase [Rhodothermales bacterium]|nr:threonylcarbamoyl-AMP synthase [Rhodothermales bacterium]